MSKINYLVGNTLGRDHIYWPTINPAELGSLGYDRIKGVTRDQIMALAWKVKKWSVSGTVDVESSRETTGSFDDDNGHFDFVTDFTYNSAFTLPSINLPMFKADGVTLAADEKDIVGGFGISEGFGFRGLRNGGFQGGSSAQVSETASFSFVSTITPEYPGNPNPVTGGDSGTFTNPHVLAVRLFGNSTDAEYVMFNADLFYPYLQADSLLSAEYYTGLRFDLDSIGTDGAVLTVDPVVAPSFTVPLIVSANSGAQSHVIESASVAVQMTATEFWEYND